MYLTKGEFLQKFGILPQEFEEADISWEELLEIADDYERRRPTLEKDPKRIRSRISAGQGKEIGLQSYHSRLKDTEHLVEKLVRKRLENYAKYRKMDAANYMRYVTDLIGIRGLLLYREDWVNFHKYITHWFKMIRRNTSVITAVTTTRTHRAIWQSRRKSIQDLAITPTFM